MADDNRSHGRDDGSCVRVSVALVRAQRLLRIADLCEPPARTTSAAPATATTG